MSFFRVKIHKIVKFSKLGDSRLLKRHKLAGSSVTLAKMKFLGAGIFRRYYTMLKENSVFSSIPHIFQGKLELKLLSDHLCLRFEIHTTIVIFCGVHDGAICLELLLLGEISTCLGNTTTGFPKCGKINEISLFWVTTG